MYINVPGEAKDITWKFGWSVLPTRDVLRKWSVTPIDKCVHCRETEPHEHPLIRCTVAKKFWLIVGRACRQLRVHEFPEGRRCPRTPLAILNLTVCFCSLWLNRHVAVKQASPRCNQSNILIYMHTMITEDFEPELFLTGGEEVLRKWSAFFIEVENWRVHQSSTPVHDLRFNYGNLTKVEKASSPPPLPAHPQSPAALLVQSVCVPKCTWFTTINGSFFFLL